MLQVYMILVTVNEEKDAGCEGGQLSVYNGEDGSGGDPFVRLCGNTAPQLAYASGDTVYLEYAKGNVDDISCFMAFWIGHD